MLIEVNLMSPPTNNTVLRQLDKGLLTGRVPKEVEMSFYELSLLFDFLHIDLTFPFFSILIVYHSHNFAII